MNGTLKVKEDCTYFSLSEFICCSNYSLNVAENVSDYEGTRPDDNFSPDVQKTKSGE